MKLHQRSPKKGGRPKVQDVQVRSDLYLCGMQKDAKSTEAAGVAGKRWSPGVPFSIPDYQGAVEAEPPRWQGVIAQLTETDQALAARANPGSFFNQLGPGLTVE